MRGMEFEQWKQSMESEATIENKELKKKIEALEKENKELMISKTNLEDDCRALANRCNAIAMVGVHGFLCIHCYLKEYNCPHRPSFSEEEKMIRNAAMNDPEFRKSTTYQDINILKKNEGQKGDKK